MMDEFMAKQLMQETAVKPVPKWIVTNQNGALVRRIIGDRAANYPFEKTFYEAYKVTLFGSTWIKDRDQPRFIRQNDCALTDAIEPPPVDPPVPAGIMWLKDDWSLWNTPFARKRPKNTSGQPMTVNMACLRYGLVPIERYHPYVTLSCALNNVTFEHWCGIMDSITPKGAKWLNGELKIPSEIVCGSNPVPVIGKLRNPGGLTGIKGGEFVYQMDTLPVDALENYTVETIPDRYIFHLTLSRNGTPTVNPSPSLGGRYGRPVKLILTSKSVMYIRAVFIESTQGHINRYNPEWEGGKV